MSRRKEARKRGREERKRRREEKKRRRRRKERKEKENLFRSFSPVAAVGNCNYDGLFKHANVVKVTNGVSSTPKTRNDGIGRDGSGTNKVAVESRRLIKVRATYCDQEELVFSDKESIIWNSSDQSRLFFFFENIGITFINSLELLTSFFSLFEDLVLFE